LKEVANLEEYKIKLKYDGQVAISTGKSRFEKSWKNKKMLWSNLVAKLATPVITPETYQEYKKMSKTDQDKIKDVGGYVGGALKNGHRKAGNVQCRQIITLDLDFAPIDFFDALEMLADYACCVYSTHKHSLDTPRFRLLIPLDREVSADEYEAIARMIASETGIDYFDDTTYQPSRLMYWPSCSADGQYYYKYLENPFMNADKILSKYGDWTDTSFWPESSRAAVSRKKLADKQGDPCLKSGLIGAFCRTYSIPEAIDQFIPDAYLKCDIPGRYTYSGGSTAAGLVIYEDEKFAYSNHGTDPASGKLCNAFDLVRLHKFADLDEDVAGDTEGTKLPSYKGMLELIQGDDNTKLTLGQEKLSNAKEEFDIEEDENWLAKLEYNNRGFLENNLKNLTLILRNDERLKGIVFNQLSDGLEVIGNIPWKHPSKFWRDADDAQLICYIDECYGTFSKINYDVAVTRVTDDRSYHPIREYLENLPEWDGVERVDTLLIDYLGATDNEYVRAVTRKTLCGAIARVMHPGCKFDTMLVLNGPQGIGKSTLISKLGGDWFSDSLHLNDTKDKTAAEKLQGYWVIEIGELAGLKKAEVDTLKGFLSKQNDIYRAAFGRRTVPHMRQCIFIGTTNAENGYLRDTTGNRRFWPVKVPGSTAKKVWNLTVNDIVQIWAEIKFLYEQGEELFIDKELSKLAEWEQREAMESDEREGLVEEYLNILLPEDWISRSVFERRAFIRNDEFETQIGTILRERICVAEIWNECFGRDLGSLKRQDSNEIAAIMAKINTWEKMQGAKKFNKYGAAKGWRRVTQ